MSMSESECFDLLTLNTAVFYELDEKSDRRRSVRCLEKFFFKACGNLGPQVFIEAGAKDASSARRARSYLPSARIVAFEANPVNFDSFQADPKNTELDVEYLNYALSSSDGSVVFHVRTIDGLKAIDGQGSMLPRAREDGIETTSVEVAAVRLDRFFASTIDRPAERCAMWVDVEGALAPVLEGAGKLLDCVDLMFVEVEDRPIWEDQWLRQDVLAYLEGFGLVPVARDYQSRYQYNIVLARRDLLNNARFRFLLAEHLSRSGAWFREKIKRRVEEEVESAVPERREDTLEKSVRRGQLVSRLKKFVSRRFRTLS